MFLIQKIHDRKVWAPKRAGNFKFLHSRVKSLATAPLSELSGKICDNIWSQSGTRKGESGMEFVMGT